jgi:uncharacterized protein
LREWQPLATKGHAGAQYHLGLLYANGQGVPRTMSKHGSGTRKPLSKDTRTVRSTWGAYMTMEGVAPQDFRMAVRWYRRAADQGNSLAQRRLGLLYERGDGVTKDYVQTYMWYKLGTANGGNTGAMMRDELAIRMTSDQLAEAK